MWLILLQEGYCHANYGSDFGLETVRLDTRGMHQRLLLVQTSVTQWTNTRYGTWPLFPGRPGGTGNVQVVRAFSLASCVKWRQSKSRLCDGEMHVLATFEPTHVTGARRRVG